MSTKTPDRFLFRSRLALRLPDVEAWRRTWSFRCARQDRKRGCKGRAPSQHRSGDRARRVWRAHYRDRGGTVWGFDTLEMVRDYLADPRLFQSDEIDRKSVVEGRIV